MHSLWKISSLQVNIMSFSLIKTNCINNPGIEPNINIGFYFEPHSYFISRSPHPPCHFPEVLCGTILKKKNFCLPPDHVRLCAPGASGQQGISERMEGATGQEYQRGCLQPHSGGAGCGTCTLLPPDPGRRAQTDQVGWIDIISSDPELSSVNLYYRIQQNGRSAGLTETTKKKYHMVLMYVRGFGDVYR